jgi:hypothetical protein
MFEYILLFVIIVIHSLPCLTRGPQPLPEFVVKVSLCFMSGVFAIWHFCTLCPKVAEIAETCDEVECVFECVCARMILYYHGSDAAFNLCKYNLKLKDVKKRSAGGLDKMNNDEFRLFFHLPILTR